MELSPEAFARFADYITAELGIKMPASKLTMLQSRLLQRVRELGLQSLDQYSAYLFESVHGGEERTQFIDAITTNKTEFLREANHFEYLVEAAIPTISDICAPGRVLVWSAGCSSGQEVYTIAMLLSEYAERNSGFDYHILGTDISTRILQRAREAIYSEAEVAPVAVPLRRKYLLRSKGPERLVRVIPALRAKTSFGQLNFMHSDYGLRQQFALVFFRNVMIYFDLETQ
jgi:chemotaxis protein methyltransferase CheR